MKNVLVFTGSYSRVLTLGTGEIVPGTGDGISVFRMDAQTGALTKLSAYPEVANPTYMTVDKTGKYLYANNELKEYSGLESASVSAFAIDAANGTLTHLNSRPTGGTDACHVAIDRDNKYVFTANFMSGSVCVLPRAADGSLAKPTCFLQHKGSSVDVKRQLGPHAHQICFDRQCRRVLVPDLGADDIVIYDVDYDKGYLIPCKVEYPRVAPGEGPRHCVFHPSGRLFYLINEMGNTVYTFSYDEETAQTKQLQVISTVPRDMSVHSTTAALKLHPSGKLLYGSNRGHNSVATYRIDDKTGLLELLDIQPTGGMIPRDIDIDPSGKFLIAGNQDSNNLVVFKINPEDGALTKVFSLDGVNAVTAVLIREFDV